MSGPKLTPETKIGLQSLLSEDRPDPARLLARLREIRSLHEFAACSGALHFLTHLELAEDEAEGVLMRLLAHRSALSTALGRDPGLRVAAVDFLSNVERRLTQPTLVERSRLERAERSALTDPLTGLHNRRFFDASLDREIRRSDRFRLSLCLFLLDLDGFKAVNDRMGHLFGDLVLQRVARLVRRALRDSDCACRYGGDELAVLLPETGLDGARAVAERIRVGVEAPFSRGPFAGRELSMTVSGGIACYPEDAREPAGLIERADEALYRSKLSGRNRIEAARRERRSHPRRPGDPLARVVLERDADARPVRLVDLSLGGILLESIDRLEPAMAVSLRLGGGDPTSERGPGRPSPECRVEARVVRVETISRGYRMGLAFEQPIPEEVLHAQSLAEGAPLPPQGSA